MAVGDLDGVAIPVWAELGRVVVWDVSARKQILRYTLTKNGPMALEFSPDSQRLAIACAGLEFIGIAVPVCIGSPLHLPNTERVIILNVRSRRGSDVASRPPARCDLLGVHPRWQPHSFGQQRSHDPLMGIGPFQGHPARRARVRGQPQRCLAEFRWTKDHRADFGKDVGRCPVGDRPNAGVRPPPRKPTALSSLCHLRSRAGMVGRFHVALLGLWNRQGDLVRAN